MRRLTDEERIALREVGPPGEGPVSPATFAECVAQGWGYWGRVSSQPAGQERPREPSGSSVSSQPAGQEHPREPSGSSDEEGSVWRVTEKGRQALMFDDYARTSSA